MITKRCFQASSFCIYCLMYWSCLLGDNREWCWASFGRFIFILTEKIFFNAPRRHCQCLLVVLLCVLFQSVISISKIRTMKWWTTRMESRFTRESFIQLKLLSLPNVSEKFYFLKNARELRYELGKLKNFSALFLKLKKNFDFQFGFHALEH